MWKKINGYDYSINEFGEVRNDKNGRILKPVKVTSGYYIVCFRKNGKIKNHYIHRLLGFAFLNLTDNMMIDHIDRDRGNNSLKNLRVVTPQQNQFNRDAKGYSWDKEKNKWEAYIKVNGKKKFLGYFDSEEDAREAYLEAKKIFHII